MRRPKDVDEYIASAPASLQPQLQQLRKAIKAAAPKADEGISYGMPYYHYKGRLVYFQLWSDHIGLYALPRPVLEQYKHELAGMITGKGTVRLPLAGRLPIALVKTMIKAQVKMKDAAAEKK
jgi:uncharacterized protein YdhG (YjbR/CyaY superfamily)